MANYTTKTIVANITGKSTAAIQDEWLTWADAWIDAKLDTEMNATTDETLYLDGNGMDAIKVSKVPIISLTKITIVDRTDVDESYEYEYGVGCDDGLIDDYFKWYSKSGIVEWDVPDDDNEVDQFIAGLKNIEITGQFGYVSVPSLVQELATYLVVKRMKIRHPELELDSEKLDDYSYKVYKGKDGKGDLESTITELVNILLGNDKEEKDFVFDV